MLRPRARNMASSAVLPSQDSPVDWMAPKPAVIFFALTSTAKEALRLPCTR